MGKMCPYCSGSGRDPITPAKGPCPMCHGEAWFFDYGVKNEGNGDKVKKRSNDSSGIFYLLILILILSLIYIIGAGYVLASEMLTHYWLGTRYTEHNWFHILFYAGFSFALVLLAARFWGIISAVIVGLIPALPVYHGTKGGVGFWFIVLNGGEDVLNNVTSSWIALLGMITINIFIAWRAQRGEDSLSTRLIRWHWIKSPTGLGCSALLFTVCSGFTYMVTEAVSHF